MQFKYYSSAERDQWYQARPGETKIGEKLPLLSHWDELTEYPQPFVLIGVAEDVGIRANFGRPGADTAFSYFIRAYAQMQHNRNLDGKQALLAGLCTFAEEQKKAAELNPQVPEQRQELMMLTARIDQALYPLIEKVVAAGKLPVVIGGGHNNAYGLLKGCSSALGQALPALNIDPHADFRPAEGRHSGNGFRYAREEGYLGRYAVWGLHESYNAEAMLAAFRQMDNLQYRSYEELLTLSVPEQRERLTHLLHWLAPTGPMGLEVDMDSVAHLPVSAASPSGWTIDQLRGWVRQVASGWAPCYVHFCEASPGQAQHESERLMLGKALAYLVSDFIKARR